MRFPLSQILLSVIFVIAPCVQAQSIDTATLAPKSAALAAPVGGAAAVGVKSSSFAKAFATAIRNAASRVVARSVLIASCPAHAASKAAIGARTVTRSGLTMVAAPDFPSRHGQQAVVK